MLEVPLSNFVGWLTGFEPATSRATVECSAIELQPPLMGLLEGVNLHSTKFEGFL